MNNLIQRSITGVIFVAVLIGAISWRHESFSALFLLITILGVWEFYKVSEIGEVRPQKVLGTLVGASFFITCSLVSMNIMNFKILLINIPLLFLIFIRELYLNKNNPFENIAYSVLGIVYVAVPMSILNFIVSPRFEVEHAYQPNTLLGFFFILWANDTGAYIFGSLFGKRKLFERISPKKSWEGTIGGALVSIGVAVLISNYFTHLNVSVWIVIALILSIIGTLGDLVESLYKRSNNIKDSGTILPGHGGILDRFDSLILSSPFVFAFLQIYYEFFS